MRAAGLTLKEETIELDRHITQANAVNQQALAGIEAGKASLGPQPQLVLHDSRGEVLLPAQLNMHQRGVRAVLPPAARVVAQVTALKAQGPARLKHHAHSRNLPRIVKPGRPGDVEGGGLHAGECTRCRDASKQ